MDEHRQRVFKNRVMKIFGPKRDEVTVDCMMRNFMVCTPHYILVGRSKKNMMGWTCHVRRRCAYRVLVGKTEGKRPLGRPRHRWEDNIIMDLLEVGQLDGGRGMEWIDLAQDKERWQAVMNTVMKPQVPWNARNFLTSWGPVIFSRRTLLHGIG